MNILFASIEDLNDWIEPLGGHPQVKTPNLNRLAARGMVFTNAQAAVPACSPSRTATLFGKAPWESGVYSNAEKWRMAFAAGRRLSLIGRMRDAGYRTTGAGKIFHMDVKGIDPEDWDSYHTDVDHKRYAPISRSVTEGGLARLSDFGPVPNAEGDFDAANTDWICRQITPGADRQFWGFGLYRPHLPFIVPQRFFDLYPDTVALPPGLGADAFRPGDRRQIADLPPESAVFANRGIGHVLKKYNEYNAFVKAYLASISYADYQLGRVLDRLEETGQIDDTLIVLWSDHGWQLGEKLAFRKFTLWERALRVPLIFAGPGIVQGRDDTPVSLMDIFPTLLARAGAPTAPSSFGVDLSPILTGQGGVGRDHVISVWGNWEEPESPRLAFTLRSRTHRYTIYWNGGEELYENATDPYEHHNMMLDAGDNVRALADHFQGLIDREIPEIAASASL